MSFLERQKIENKLKGLKDEKETFSKIQEFERRVDYFWFIYNKPSLFFKYNYCINRGWRNMTVKTKIKQMLPSEVQNSLVPYYRDPLEILKKISQSCYNPVLGDYKSPFQIN